MTGDRLRRLLGSVGFDPEPILGHPRFGELSNRALCQMALVAVTSAPGSDLSILADYPAEGLTGPEFARLTEGRRRLSDSPAE